MVEASDVKLTLALCPTPQFEVQVSNSLADLQWHGVVPIKLYGDRDIRCNRNNRAVINPFYIIAAGELVMMWLRTPRPWHRDIEPLWQGRLHTMSHHQPHLRDTMYCRPYQGTKVNVFRAGVLRVYQGRGYIPRRKQCPTMWWRRPSYPPSTPCPRGTTGTAQTRVVAYGGVSIIGKVDRPTDCDNSFICVEKENGDLRIDPKDLNKVIRPEYHYTPTLDDELPCLNMAKVFSKLYARSGYWNVHVRLDEQSQLWTTFRLHLADIAFTACLSVWYWHRTYFRKSTKCTKGWNDSSLLPMT